VLEIGGRGNPYQETIFKNYDHHSIDIKKTDANVIVVDITHCPELDSEQYDFILSVDVFEHINAPWLAATEITRLLKPNGVTYQSTFFS
jgi:2-polyprenyl-3-methyl-5-hydroxy-6-metoxy-1,4-benzoquinol methylase